MLFYLLTCLIKKVKTQDLEWMAADRNGWRDRACVSCLLVIVLSLSFSQSCSHIPWCLTSCFTTHRLRFMCCVVTSQAQCPSLSIPSFSSIILRCLSCLWLSTSSSVPPPPAAQCPPVHESLYLSDIPRASTSTCRKCKCIILSMRS